MEKGLGEGKAEETKMGQEDSLREEGPGTGLAADSGDSVMGSLVLTKSCGSGVLKGFLVLLLTDMY